ncbi:Mucolipin 3 [Fasciolopsis buskii]|uniref:Mucolipin 3 n=1 Tax=Fasciolopsis buskii TaxID=27845 RepID=A0A8E0S0M1_9TREM|nr:Mucolipin 3 [Fasciolopsis buski]
MPKRTSHSRRSHQSKGTTGFSSSLSDASAPMEYESIEDPIQATNVPHQEFLPRLSPAALSVAHSRLTLIENSDRMILNIPDHSGIRNKLESFLLRVAGCCTTGLNYGGHGIDNPPLLSSASYSSDALYTGCNLTHGNSSNQRELQQCQCAFGDRSINTEVVNWMQRRLSYFFMTPMEKYKAKHRVPFKLFVQILKVLFITLQVIAVRVKLCELVMKLFGLFNQSVVP